MATPDFLSTISRRAIIAAGVVLVSVILSGTALTIGILRDLALDRARSDLSNLVAVLAEQTQRSIKAIDLVVSATATDFAASQVGGDTSRQALHERLRERSAALPELEGVAVLDRDGAMIDHSRRSPPPAANYADRDYFTPHRDGRSSGLYVGAPVMGRVSPGWQQTFTRRIEGPQNEFLGVVSAGVRVDQFDPLYRSLRLGAGGRVTVFRADGVLLGTYPPAEAMIGRSFADDPLFKSSLAAARSGVQSRWGFIDREPRLIAYEQLRDYPVVVAISSTEQYALADWRKGAVTAGVVAGGVSLIIGITILLLLKEQAQSSTLRGELDISRDRLQGIIQSAMDAIIAVDEMQNVVLFNAAAERIFRCTAADAVGGPLDRFIPERFREAHRAHIERFGVTRATTRMMGARLALFGLRADGEEFPIDASISHVSVDGRSVYTVILRDVTERKQSEAKLQQERDTAQRYLDVAGVMLVALDSNGTVTLINRKGCELLGYPEEEILGRSWFDRFVPERHREDTRRVFGQLMAGETQLRSAHENPVLTRDGAERVIAWRNQTLTDEGGAIIGTLSSGEDITERKNAQDALERSYRELRELSIVMNEVREAERTRIARELHDELAQWLTALKMDVAWLSARLPSGHENLVARAERMRGVVDTTVASVRRIAADLRPVMLDDLGLVPSIEHLLHALAERANIAVRLDVPDHGFDFKDPLATAIYRMVQEALTNVARHARATEVRVMLTREGDALAIRITDNGVGLGRAPTGRKSYGILGIRERAQTIGGVAEVYSPAAGGTVVEISIPLERYTGAEATS